MDALEKEKGKIKLTSNVGVAKLNPGTQRSDRAKAQSRTREGMIRRKRAESRMRGCVVRQRNIKQQQGSGRRGRVTEEIRHQ